MNFLGRGHFLSANKQYQQQQQQLLLLLQRKSAQKRRKQCALAVVRRTHKQTHKTDRGDYNTLRSLARSVTCCFCFFFFYYYYYYYNTTFGFLFNWPVFCTSLGSSECLLKKTIFIGSPVQVFYRRDVSNLEGWTTHTNKQTDGNLQSAWREKEEDFA